MTYKYTSLARVLADMNDDRAVDRDDVHPRVRDVPIWHMIASFPGCLGDNHAVARSREAVLSEVEFWLDEEREYSARYVRGQLRRFGHCDLRDGRVITIERHSVSELF